VLQPATVHRSGVADFGAVNETVSNRFLRFSIRRRLFLGTDRRNRMSISSRVRTLAWNVEVECRLWTGNTPRDRGRRFADPQGER